MMGDSQHGLSAQEGSIQVCTCTAHTYPCKHAYMCTHTHTMEQSNSDTYCYSILNSHLHPFCFEICISIYKCVHCTHTHSQVELEEIESQAEEYPLTRSFLSLLVPLTNVPLPLALGAGHRVPGLEPYLEFVRDKVFLKFDTRAYHNPDEKVPALNFVGLLACVVCVH